MTQRPKGGNKQPDLRRQAVRGVALIAAAGGLAWGAARLWEWRLHQPALEHYRRGNKLAAAGQAEAAMDEWQVATQREPWWIEPYLRMSDAFHEHGRDDLAVQALRKALEANPKAPHLLCRIAGRYADLGDAVGAAGWAAEAIRKEPNCARAHYLYAQTHRGKDLGEATRHLQRAHELAPTDRGILLDLVRLQADAGNLAEADRVLQSASQGAANDVDTQYLLGLVHGRRARQPAEYEEAAGHLRQAVRLNPEYHAAYAELGLLYERQRRWKDSATWFDRAYALNPYSATILFHVATVYRQLADPRAEAKWDELRALQKKTGKFQALRDELQKHPNDMALTLETAELSRQLGGWDLARNLAQSVVDHDPTNRKAQRLLADLLPLAAPAKPGTSPTKQPGPPQH